MTFNDPYTIVEVNDVTASRSTFTTYTNTSGRTMFLLITIDANVTAANGYAYIIEYINGVQIAESGMVGSSVVLRAALQSCILIKPGNTYRVEHFNGLGTCTISKWIEAY